MYPETIEYIVAGCPVIAQSVYLGCHNAMASAVHWSLCALCGFPRSLSIFLETGAFPVRRPNLVFVDKCSGCTKLIDVPCVMDKHVIDRHREKAEKCFDLARVTDFMEQ